MTNSERIYDYDFYRKNYSEKEIREFISSGEIYWDFWWEISECQTLSEDFIREFQDKVEWEYISEFQNLSEDFIRDFQDRVVWWSISKYQTLSEEFLIEFIEKVDTIVLIENKKIPEDVKQRIINLKKVIDQ